MVFILLVLNPMKIGEQIITSVLQNVEHISIFEWKF